MRLIITLFTLLLMSSCSREVYHSIDGFYFTVQGLEKAELIIVLDDFSSIEGYEKLPEGGEKIMPNYKVNLMMARYKNDDGYQFSVNNILNKNCFSVSTHDMERRGEDEAKNISRQLKLRLETEYKSTFRIHKDQYCKIAH